MKVISGGQFLHVKLIYIDKVNEDELGLRLSPYKSSLGTLFVPPPHLFAFLFYHPHYAFYYAQASICPFCSM